MKETKNRAAHEPRMTGLLRVLMHEQRVASLACLDAQGLPSVSMVPFAMLPSLESLVIHVSALAPHTGMMLANPQVSLMVCRPEIPGQPVHALERVSMQATAVPLVPDEAHWLACREAYLARFEEARMMTTLPDFSFFSLKPYQGRHIAGFGAAREVDIAEWARIMQR